MGVSRRPKRETGAIRPVPGDEISKGRSERAQEVVETIWVDHPPQRRIIDDIRSYMRVCSRRRNGTKRTLNGRRLSQHWQAGKSATFERLKYEIAQEEIAAGLEPNPYRVIHITLDERMTLKMLYQEILNRLADEFPDEPGRAGRRPGPRADGKTSLSRDNIKVLEQRVEEWVVRLGVELIVVDEVQRLEGSSKDAEELTKKLMSFLDRGVVPIVFIGDETSKTFFSINPKFAARLLKPLKLEPLGTKKVSDRKMFFDFCTDFDDQLIALDVTSTSSCLRDPDVLDALIKISQGHVGRVARLIQVALPEALARGAITLERFDLSRATEDYAIDLGWIDVDPFLTSEA